MREDTASTADGFCVFGASGHGLAIGVDIERAFARLGLGPLRAFIDDERSGERLAGTPVVSFDAWQAGLRHLRCFVGLGAPGARRAVAARLAAAGATFDRLYDRHAPPLHPLATIAEGSIIAWNSYLGPLTTIGAHVQILANVSIGHDVAIGSFATICPSCTVSGHVGIGEGAFLGAGTVVVNGRRGRPLRIGRDAVLAAGSVVTKDVPDAARWSGNPARPLRETARLRRAPRPHPGRAGATGDC